MPVRVGPNAGFVATRVAVGTGRLTHLLGMPSRYQAVDSLGPMWGPPDPTSRDSVTEIGESSTMQTAESLRNSWLRCAQERT